MSLVLNRTCFIVMKNHQIFRRDVLHCSLFGHIPAANPARNQHFDLSPWTEVLLSRLNFFTLARAMLQKWAGVEIGFQ